MNSGSSALLWSALTCCMVLLIYPLISEETQSSCHATEKFVIRQIVKHTSLAGQSNADKIFAGGVLNAFSTGSIAATFVKDRYPAIPASIGCWMMWWKVFFDPTEVQVVAKELGLPR